MIASGKNPASFALHVLEHCAEDLREEVWVDGAHRRGRRQRRGAARAGRSAEVADPATLAADETMVVPPEQRASAIVRGLLAKLMVPLQADAVFEEQLAVEALELVYRPIWAFEFELPAKGRRGVVEVDGLTGEAGTATSLQAPDQPPRQPRRHVRHRRRHGRAPRARRQHRVKLARVAIDHNY